MKRLFVFISIIAVVIAGAAYAQDQPGPAVEAPAASSVADQPSPAAEESAATATEAEPAAGAQEPEKEIRKQRVGVGLMAGMYYPMDSQVKDVFGDSWVRVGFRPLLIEVPHRWLWSWDVSYYTMSHDVYFMSDLLYRDEVTLIPITVGLLHGSGSDKRRTYFSVGVGPYYGDVTSPSLGVNKSGWGLNANATAGVIWKKRWSLEARYEFMDKFAGLDFSAFTISAAYKLFDMR